jgi:CRISPR-associated endoribonuclease Cas6
LDNVHDSDAPAPFTFSDPLPHGDMEVGDERRLIVSSPHGRDLYDLLIADLSADPELNLGHMCFEVTDARTVEIDVGPPGSTGTIKTPTGLVQPLSQGVCETHGITPPENSETLYWASENHPPLALFEQVRRNLSQKLDAYHPPSVTDPVKTDTPLFSGYELYDAGAMPRTVSTDKTGLLFYSKWELEYEVRDDDHRTWLNTLLACGFGAKCAYGLGYGYVTNQSLAAETAADSKGVESESQPSEDKSATCPTCGRDDFKNDRGVRMHHASAHDEPLLDARVCPNCEEDFEAPHWQEKKFCSRLCSNKFRGEGKQETRSCAWCGLSLETWPSWDTEYHQKCYFEATADRDRPDELAGLARVLYGDEERAIREAWRLARGHGYDVTKDEFRALLEKLDILRTSLARQLESGEIDLDAEHA